MMQLNICIQLIKTISIWVQLQFHVRPKLLSWFQSRKIERPKIKYDEAIKERIEEPQQECCKYFDSSKKLLREKKIK